MESLGVIHELENVQKRATKLMPTLRDLLYSEKLQNLNLLSLSYRRDHIDLIMTFKIFNGAVLVDKYYFFTMNNTRSNQFKIYKKFNKTATRQTGFSQRIINK